MVNYTDASGGGGGSARNVTIETKMWPAFDREAAQTLLKNKLSGLDIPPFPAATSKTHCVKAEDSTTTIIEDVRWRHGQTPSIILRAAWAILIHWYIDTPEVLFGVATTPHRRPGDSISIPHRIPAIGTIDKLLLSVQENSTELAPLEAYSLVNAEQAKAEVKATCDLHSLLAIDHPAPGAFIDEYALIADCQVKRSSLHVTILYDAAVVHANMARRLLDQLRHIIQQLNCAVGLVEVAGLSRVSQSELRDLWQQQAQVPKMIEDCVHHVFAKRVAETPNAPAICAWDGEMTYSQLDRRSTRLAEYLHSLDLSIGADTVIPLYFEKSKWVPVAIMAVMKLGAASVALDSTLPKSRVESIIAQVTPPVVLSSRECMTLAEAVSEGPVIAVDQLLDERKTSPVSMPAVDPASNLYIVFTSGSTGVPKGATVTHANFCSAAVHQQELLGFQRSSRVFDYTSYSFDVAWSNVLHTLMVGACLCIPSEYDRTADISGSINRLRADFVHLTPTLGRFLDPSTLGGLTKVLFIGEALKASDVVRWRNSNAELYNTYGPAECTVTSTIVKIPRADECTADPSIGVGVGCVPWITQPGNPEELAAIGAPGELWLEGPIVGAGYLKNPEKTAHAFVKDPKWLVRGSPGHLPGRHGTLYRTGDLAYYAPDGSLGFIGRKDTQVKFNGQRMELGEVEVHCRELLPVELVPQVVVDVVVPSATNNQTLAAFMLMKASDIETKLSSLVTELRTKMSERLPSFMVPSAYIALEKLPMTASGKTDRKGIQALGKDYNPLSSSSADEQTEDQLNQLSPTENLLRTAWAEVLGIKADVILARHTFVELGGNSIKTMSLAMAINRSFDVRIGVQKLVEQQRSLRELSTMIDALRQGRSVDSPMPIDLEHEVDILANEIHYCRPASAGTVFLTGATGFLGTQILRQTLAKRAFDKVVVLVRAVNGQQGMDRIRSAAVTAGWWQESYIPTIEVWEGDLAAENLGLSDARWDALCGRPSSAGTIEAIIHNGAIVHWSSNYDDLKIVNVGSTVKLLQAAMDSPFVKTFVYVSGGLITDSRIWTKEEESMANGYDQSKYVSERLVSAASAKSRKNGTKFSVVKPGQIIGDVFTGVANADDFLWRVVVSAIRIGARPIEPDQSWLSISDVRHVAETVLWHATGTSSEDFTHIKRGIWVSTFWSALEQQLYQTLTPVSWGRWTELAKQDMGDERELHPLFPVQQYLGALGIENACSQACEWEMQEVVAATRRNIEYLRSKGLTSTERSLAQFDMTAQARTNHMRSAITV